MFLGDVIELDSSIGSLCFDIPEFCTWVKELGLSQADKDRLTGGEWLSANHICAAQQLMKNQYAMQNGLQDTCVLLETMTWSSQCDDFVQIICIKPGHWACISNKFSPEGSVDLYDSLHTIPKESGSIAKQVCTILKSNQQRVTINVINVQRQDGYDDCGLFARAMATDLCAGKDPATVKYYQDRMRSHLKICFEKKCLECFPSVSKPPGRSRVGHQSTIEIYCVNLCVSSS